MDELLSHISASPPEIAGESADSLRTVLESQNLTVLSLISAGESSERMGAAYISIATLLYLKRKDTDIHMTVWAPETAFDEPQAIRKVRTLPVGHTNYIGKDLTLHDEGSSKRPHVVIPDQEPQDLLAYLQALRMHPYVFISLTKGDFAQVEHTTRLHKDKPSHPQLAFAPVIAPEMHTNERPEPHRRRKVQDEVPPLIEALSKMPEVMRNAALQRLTFDQQKAIRERFKFSKTGVLVINGKVAAEQAHIQQNALYRNIKFGLQTLSHWISLEGGSPRLIESDHAHAVRAMSGNKK